MMRHAIASAMICAATPLAAEITAPSVPDGVLWSSGFGVAVAACWNTAGMAADAAQTEVLVAVAFARDGRPEPDSISLLSYQNGTAAAAEHAFAAARSAILRCAGDGYDLPASQYQTWQRMDLTFDAKAPIR